MLATEPKPKRKLTPYNNPEYLREIGKKGGRPKQVHDPADEAQAFESIKAKWTKISHTLADEALKASRDTKNINPKTLVATCTAAGIAYDKRWSKTTDSSTEVAIPPSLLASVSRKIMVNQDLTAKVAVLGQDSPPDPDLLKAAMEDLLGF